MTVVITGALIIGLSLGLLGSGGSAITVPILVYLVGHHAKQSIAESMAIVGMISLAAAVPYAKARQIHWNSVLFFGVPGMLGTLGGAWLGGVAPATLQLIVFGGVLILAAYALVRKPTSAADHTVTPDADLDRRWPWWQITLEGIVVGIVTGFVGVGGGFLIVPALVVFGKLPIRLAIGTSLMIIALKAAVGFVKYQQYLVLHNMSVDVQTVLLFVMIGVAGGLIGQTLNRRMNQRLLKQVFAVFLVVLGGFVIVHEAGKSAARPNGQQATGPQAAQFQPAAHQDAAHQDAVPPLHERRLDGHSPHVFSDLPNNQSLAGNLPRS